jgi:hypothetical protein
MVMAEPQRMAKIATWDELVLSDLVIHSGNLTLGMRYANVCSSSDGGIRRPGYYAGAQVVSRPRPYDPIKDPQARIAPGEQVVIVRFFAVRQGWTPLRAVTSASLGIVPPSQRDPGVCNRVCLPYTRLGMIQYDNA